MTRIGLFDSGVGGLSVLKTLEHSFPSASFVYLADRAHFPFGTKSRPELLRIASQAVAFLLTQQVDLIVIACHTASVHTLDTLQAQFPVPIIGMVEPTLAALSKLKLKNHIGLLATQSTLDSKLYDRLIEGELISHASPKLITLIEQGQSPTPEEIRIELKPLLDKRLDVLILASTHFPHIEHQIEEELASTTQLLSPANEVALHVAPFVHTAATPEPHLLYTTGSIEGLQEFVKHWPSKRTCTINQI